MSKQASYYKELSIKEFTRMAKSYESDSAGIYNLCKKDYPDILEEYFKTHEHMEVSYRSKKVILTKCLGVCIFMVILIICALIPAAVVGWLITLV